MKTLAQTVSVLVDPDQSNWDEVIPYAMMAYRSSPQESTGETPNMMMLGRQVDLPVDLMVEPLPTGVTERTDYSLQLREKLQSAHRRARIALQKSAIAQKRHYEPGQHGSELTTGQFVWLRAEACKRGKSKKLTANRWEGPFLIIDKLSDVTFRIQRSQHSKQKVVHYDRLKPYEGTQAVDWRQQDQRQPDGEKSASPELIDNTIPKDNNLGDTETFPGSMSLDDLYQAEDTDVVNIDFGPDHTEKEIHQ
ncbi:uncharacterized protein [Ptychodera flava]|uniref:uncharacterized protein n=1 Tax=Ptychodera flava TaxID=63121 RepID=UPI00396A16D3